MPESSPPVHSAEKLSLPDGRVLAYSHYGDPSGNPVFFFHGWPGARLQGALAEEPARDLGLNVIAPDRPGFGHSDFQSKRQILDWPDDLLSLADHLQLDTFGLIGLSGGAPYALACAYQIPERISKVAIVSGVGPRDVPGSEQGVSDENRRLVRLASFVPWVVTLILKRVAWQRRRDPHRAFEKLLASLPEADRQALSRQEVREKAMQASTDSFEPGVKGHSWEMRLFSQSWGFELEQIQTPVALWHGNQDENILPLTGRRMAETIPNCTAKFLPNEGHYSLFIDHIGEILQELSVGFASEDLLDY